MEFWKDKPSCDQVRQLDMVQFLSNIGHEPVKIKGNDFWYISPFRVERTASFKINIKRNRFYDFGQGFGGNLIDFGTRYYNCSVSNFLEGFIGNNCFKQPAIADKNLLPDDSHKITVLEHCHITAPALLRYLKLRKISLGTASQFCCELRYMAGSKHYYAIGFRNDKGGYEIRNKYFKGSSSPKTITTIRSGCDRISVFEGFFNFLSFLEISQNIQSEPSDFLILNSLSFFDQARAFMESYLSVELYLDNNPVGRNSSRLALSSAPCYHDKSGLYQGHEDLNDYLCGLRMESPEIENLNHKPPS